MGSLLLVCSPSLSLTEECEGLGSNEGLRWPIAFLRGSYWQGKGGRWAGGGVENEPVIKTKNTASFGFKALHFSDESSAWFSLIAHAVCVLLRNKSGGLKS